VTLTVTVCVPLSLDPRGTLSERVADLDADIEICYPAELLPSQRFPADHRGDDGFARGASDERQWRDLLARTDVALGIPGDSADGFSQLFALAPGLRWVQGTAAGTGEQLLGAEADDAMLARVAVTSAAGLHAAPLAEFALFGLLALAKDFDRLDELNRRREWGARWPMRQLASSTVAVVGLGGVGRAVARLLGALGSHVYAVHRSTPTGPVEGSSVDVSLAQLDDVLPACDAVVLALPGTAHTRGLLGAERLRRLPEHAVVVNVGRGSVVDTDALVAALDQGRLRGAALDVTDVEPLPADSPLWARPNVILSPHTAALTVDEDDRIVDLFGSNLRRFVKGEQLSNLVEVARGY
jgi:glyoxylate/hydroxypyruvate reductase A